MATVTIDSTRTFKDLDLSFTIHPVRKDINTHVNEYAIINSVKNFLRIRIGERHLVCKSSDETVSFRDIGLDAFSLL